MTLSKSLFRRLGEHYSLWVSVCCMAVVTMYFSLIIPEKSVGFLSDDAVFLLMADIYSPWVDAIQPLYGYLVEHNRFPPLYPLLLALLGVDSNDAALASQITTLLWCLGFICVGTWLYREQGSRLLACLIPVLCALTPSMLLLSQELWSESLYFLLSFLFFTVLSFIRKEHAAATVLCGLLVCLLLLTRSIGLVLFLAFSAFLVANRPAGWRLAMLVSILPYLTWLGIQQLNSATESYYVELIHALADQGVDNIITALGSRLTNLWQSWCWLFTLMYASELSLFLQLFFALFLLLVVVGAGSRLRRGYADAFYFVFYLAALLLWPYGELHFQTRFLSPLMPLYFFYAYTGARIIVRRNIPGLPVYSILLLLLLAQLIPATTTLLQRAFEPVTAEYVPVSRNREWLLATSLDAGRKILVSQHRTVQLLLQISREIPKQECVFAIQGPIVMLYSKRIVGVYPDDAVNNWESFSRSPACHFLLAMNMVDHRGIFPPLFPCELVNNNDNFIKRVYYITEQNQQLEHMCLIKKTF